MKTVTEILNAAYDKVLQGGYPKLYLAADVHDTILMKSKRRILENGVPKELILPQISSEYFYYKAIESLQNLSRSDRIQIILFTSSSDTEIKGYLELFKSLDIRIAAVNSNPEVVSDVSYADFSRKFYYDVLLDDKAGFDPKKDWEEIYNWTLTRLPHIVNYQKNLDMNIAMDNSLEMPF